MDIKTRALVEEIEDTDWVETESELDALFLESEMVKRYMPRYNILLRDDKSQMFVRIDMKSEWPTVSFTLQRAIDQALERGALVVVAAVATVLALAPVALHRALFRRGAKPQLVRAANVLLRLALAAIALALSGTVFLIFDVVIDHPAAVVAGGATLALSVAMWVVLPMFLRGPRE